MTPNNTLTRSLLLCLAVVLTPRPAEGQDFLPENSRRIHLATEDGLPHREVRAAVRDTAGIIWLGTAAGLVRHEGDRFTTFSGPHGRYRQGIISGYGGWLYDGVPGHPDSFEVFNPYRLRGAGYGMAEFGVDGDRVVLTGGGPPAVLGDTAVHLLFPGPEARVTSLPLPNSLHPRVRKNDPAPPSLRLLHALDNGYLLHNADQNRIVEWRNGRCRKVQLPGKAGPDEVGYTSDGRLYAVGAFGLRVWVPRDAGYVAQTLPDQFDQALNHASVDACGRLIVWYFHPFATRCQRLYLLDGDTTHDLDWIRRVDDRIINISGRDFARRIRLSTYGGLQTVIFERPDRGRFQRYLYNPAIEKTKFGHVMRGFASDGDGVVYANKDSYLNGWLRLRPGASRVDTLWIEDGRGNRIIQWGCGTNLLHVDAYIYGHSCWRSADSTSAHLYRYTPAEDTWKAFYLPTNDQIIRYITETDGGGDLYLFTQNERKEGDGAVFLFQAASGTFERLPIIGPHQLTGYPRKVHFRPGDRYAWIGTTTALFRYEPATGALHRYLFPDGRPTRIMEVLLTGEGKLLLGTLGAGIHLFDPRDETFTHVGGKLAGQSTRPREAFITLPSDDIANVAFGRDERELIITTFNGLVVHTEGNSQVYTTREGLTHNEFNTSSLHFDSLSGRWFAGGVNGFVSFDAEVLGGERSAFQPALLSMRYFDEDVGVEQTTPLPPAPTDVLRIDPSIAFFTLNYLLPDYANLTHVRFETKLEGFDPGWRSPSAETSVRYTRLPPGKFQFRLRAADGHGRLTRELPPLTIHVLKPWYRHLWFYFLVITVMALVISLIVRGRFQELRERFQTQQQLQELELRTLRQQMNPHFISNAMNAIREFIYREEPEKAAGYLADFSRLMRRFLEASRQPFTTIAEETDLLRYYIELEQLRFPGRFTYKIDIDPAIDPEMDEVPTFILQPIVENAIIHGLTPFPGGGELRIRFRLDPDDDDILCCEVTDNGAGREAAARKSTPREHTSRGTQILSDRTALLASNENTRLTVKTSDLRPGHARPGTRVVVTVATHHAV